MEAALVRRIDETPVVRLTGPRTCGKTTTCTRIVAGRGGSIVRLDDPDERRAAAADPAGYLRDLPRPVLVDEYQFVPDVLAVVKASLSRSPGALGSWLLCGSTSIDALTSATESLGGRLTDVTMGTLTLDERRDLAKPLLLVRLLSDSPAFLHGWRPPVRLTRDELLTEAVTGVFPLVVDQHGREGARRRPLADWVSAAVIADGTAIAGVRNTEELCRMLRLYAAATGPITPKDLPTANRLERPPRSTRLAVRVLDTSVAVDHLRGPQPATQLLDALLDSQVALVTFEVVRFERLAGCSVRPRFRGQPQRHRHNRLPHRRHRHVLDAPLLTTNVRHFPMFDGLAPPY